MMYKALTFILIISVCVALLGVVIHEVSPQYMAALMSNPTVRSVSASIHNVIRRLYPAQNSPKVKKSKVKKEKLFTAEELRNYNGKEGNKGPYLALLGRVYNVKKGAKHYGPGGSYEFFAGRDASRAFITGEFTEEGLTDDITGLTPGDYVGLDEWQNFYEKDYKYVGKLIGRYYDNNGEPTAYYVDAHKWIADGYSNRDNDNQEKKMFPPCNSEWHHETGSRLWCTTRSGGVDRDWVGVPRKLFNPGKGQPRCACVKDTGPPSHDPTRTNHNNRGDLDNPNLQEYPGCAPDRPVCSVKEV